MVLHGLGGVNGHIIKLDVGRPFIEIADEIILEEEKLKTHLKQFFADIIDDDDFRTALPGNLNDGPVTIQRIQTVQNRIKRIITG